MTSLKEEAAKIILESAKSAKKREKKTAKPIPHEDIGDPNQKGFALESEEIIVETLPANASVKTYIDDFIASRNKKFSGDSKRQRIRRAIGAWYNHKGK